MDHPDASWPLRLGVIAVVECILAVWIAVAFHRGWILGIPMLLMAAYLARESRRQWCLRRDASDDAGDV